MSDFARTSSDRAAVRERDTPGVLARSARILAALELAGKSPIERSLAIGAACPFAAQWERTLWLDAVRQFEEQVSPEIQTAAARVELHPEVSAAVGGNEGAR